MNGSNERKAPPKIEGAFLLDFSLGENVASAQVSPVRSLLGSAFPSENVAVRSAIFESMLSMFLIDQYFFG